MYLGTLCSHTFLICFVSCKCHAAKIAGLALKLPTQVYCLSCDVYLTNLGTISDSMFADHMTTPTESQATMKVNETSLACTNDGAKRQPSPCNRSVTCVE